MGKQESEKTVTGSDGSGRYERKALIDKLYETQGTEQGGNGFA